MYFNLPKLTTIILLCFFAVAAHSQRVGINEVPFSYPNDFGGKINCIFTDKMGFIWIGKETGLYRYDGLRVKAFRNNPSDSLSISSNIILAIAEDPTGNLWIGTRGGGLNYYCQKNGRFTRYLHNDKNQHSISFDEVMDIMFIGNNNFLIATDGGGLNMFNIHTRKFQNIRANKKDPNSLQSNKVLTIAPSQNGKYWLGTWGGGLYLFDPVSQKIQHIGKGTRYEHSNILYIKEVKPGIVWVGTFDHGLLEYNVRNNLFSVIVPHGIIQSFRNIQVTKKGEIYVASNSGLLYFPSASSDFQIIESENNRFVTITEIYVDPNQILWIGSGSGLLGKINPFRKKFNTFPSGFIYGNSQVFSILADDKSRLIYYTYVNQLIRCNFSLNKFEPFDIQMKYSISMIDLPAKNSLLCKGDSVLLLFNKDNKTTSRLKLDKWPNTDITGIGKNTLIADGPYSFWTVGNQAVYRIVNDLKLNKWKVDKTYRIGEPGEIAESHYPTSLLLHPNGDFFVGTWGGGINRLKRGAKQFTGYAHNPTNPQSLSNNYVECLAADSAGNLWIGTQAGLNRLNLKNEEIKYLQAPDGLADDWVFAIATDEKNRAWISTRKGLSCISSDFKTIRNYDINDGLPFNIFLPRSVATTSSGYMYFGSQKGMVWFHPDSILDNTILSQAAIVDFIVNEKSAEISETGVLQQSIELTNEIRLSHKNRSFSFQLAALGYSNSQRNSIMYKLDEYDKYWQTAGANQVATYGDLPPGKYTFRVRASNEDRHWNPKEREIRVIIAQHPLLSYYALIIYILILAFIVWYTIARRKKRREATSENGLLMSTSGSGPDVIQPSQIIKESVDQKFLQKAMSVVEENMSDPEFGVSQLVEKMCLSRTHIYMKINSMAGVSIAEFIKIVRLKRAAQLLEQKAGSISEVAFQVGFNDPKYFRKCFKQQFGVTPAQFIQKDKNSNIHTNND